MKNKKNNNKGIIISGGTINTNNLSVGNNASINSKETTSENTKNGQDDFQINIQNLISEGKLEEAIKVVKELAQNNSNKNLLRGILLIASNHSLLQDQKMHDLITLEKYSVENSKIASNILTLVESKL